MSWQATRRQFIRIMWGDMQEFYHVFQATKGLQRFPELSDEKLWYETIKGLWSRDDLLIKYQPVNLLMEANQLIVLRDWVVVVTDTDVIFYDHGMNHYQDFPVIGGFWSFADFGDWWILTNGLDFIYPDIDDHLIIQKSSSYGDFPHARTFCNWNGQLFCGGLYNNWNGLGEYAVAMSEIGNASFELSALNTAGWYNKLEPVIRLLPVADGVVVFTASSVWKLTPEGVHYADTKLADVGLLEPRAVAVGDYGIIYKGADGELKLLTSDGMERLGYAKYLNTYTIINWDSVERRYFITSGEHSYVFTRDGLFEIPDRVVGVGTVDGEQLYIGTAAQMPDNIELVTSAYHGRQALKYLRMVTAVGDLTGDLRIQPLVRYMSSPQQWLAGGSKVFVENTGYPEVAADAFKIRIFGECYDATLRQLQMHIQYNDRRRIHGVSVEQASNNAQGGA